MINGGEMHNKLARAQGVLGNTVLGPLLEVKEDEWLSLRSLRTSQMTGPTRIIKVSSRGRAELIFKYAGKITK